MINDFATLESVGSDESSDIINQVLEFAERVTRMIVEPELTNSVAPPPSGASAPKGDEPSSHSRSAHLGSLMMKVTLNLEDAESGISERTTNAIDLALAAICEYATEKMERPRRILLQATFGTGAGIRHLLQEPRALPLVDLYGYQHSEDQIEIHQNFRSPFINASRARLSEQFGQVQGSVENISPEDAPSDDGEWQFPPGGHGMPFDFGNSNPFGGF